MGIAEKFEVYKRYVLDSRFRRDAKLVEYAEDGYVQYGINTLEDLDVFDALKGGATLNEVCEETGIKHKDMLEMMLDMLVREDMLEYNDGVYTINEIQDTFTEEQYEWIEKTSPISVDFTMFLLDGSKEVLKTGEPMDNAGFQGEFKEIWDELMDDWPYSFKKLMLDEMNIEDGDRILDLGCGSGSMIEMMLENIDKDVHITGVDRSEEFMDIAEKRLEELKKITDSETVKGNIDRVKLEQCDLMETFPERDDYDHVIASLVLHHIPKEDRHVVMKNVADILNSDGKFGIYEFLNPSEHEKLPFWLMYCVPPFKGYPQRNEFLSVLNENFNNVKTYAKDTVIIAEK